jgi:NACalpha-BTF3-like transcription factor
VSLFPLVLVLVTLLDLLNVVTKRRLWPRAILQPPLTEADERALKSYVEQEERTPEEDVKVVIDETMASWNDARPA